LVESLATRNLQYLPSVFSEFALDRDGDFSVAEVDGRIAGCAKFTVLPDGSAWLEALRVMPEFQGQGLGKAFYRRFFEMARPKGIKVMRMYTGVKNVVSKGLAERFGFKLAATYRGAGKAVQAGGSDARVPFQKVSDPDRAVELLMPLKDKWTGFVIMNRTFYELTPALCKAWSQEGKVYEEPVSGSVVALGARFMPGQAVHVAAFGGDPALSFAFAAELAAQRGASKVQCMFAPGAQDIQELLLSQGFELDQSDYIVMQVQVDSGNELLRRP
jgi:ribosomal-protein-alanine N-acetyltransferase